jgi:glycosyltransferase involved in cell wall biosynthesis
MPKVSVIIPVYNEEKVIKDCLESLVKQTYKNLEIIVVDDGSKDKSKVKIQKAKSQFKIKNLKLLEQKHKGAGAARNLGAKRAKGDILVFIDADMTFDKNFIKKLVAPIEEGRAIGTFSKEEYLANKDNVWAKGWNINRGLPMFKMHPEDYPETQKVFRAISKSAFKKVGGFDEKAGYTDDWTLSEKLGVEAINAPGAIFYHKNPDSLREVFVQSRWMAKRKYKLGMIGSLVALMRVSLPVSVLIGVVKSLKDKLPSFLVFKIVSDLGQFIGILEYLIFRKVSK